MNNWKPIITENDFYSIIEQSDVKPQIIFKDSTTCGISAHAKERLLKDYGQIEADADFHYLDLLRFRSISNLIAQELNVTHQSPQIIVLKHRKPVYTVSHHAINVANIAKSLL